MGGRQFDRVAAKNSVRPSEGAAEGGCGGNSAAPERNQTEASPAALLVKAKHHRKILFSLGEKEIRRAQNEKSKEYFSVVRRALASGGGAASLVPFKVGSREVYNYSTMPRHKFPDIDFPWSPSLAYVVGLITTDGNLSQDGRHIVIKSADKQLLQTYKDCLQLKNNKIRQENNGKCYRVQFSDVQFYRWLQKIGISPAKSLTIGKIDLPDNYFKDFLRGHLDGDGSIILYNDKYNVYKGRRYSNLRTYVYFLSASEKHIKWLRKTISRLIGIKGALIQRTQRDKNRATLWYIKMSRYEAKYLLKWIYYRHDVPCLLRKRKIAEKALKLAENWKRKTYNFINN